MIEHAYIHIPFCLRKCNYCSFISGENIKNKDIYFSALMKEIQYRYKGEKLKSIYFGGGTPSLVDCDNIKKVLKQFNIDNDAEITLEANPETVTLDKMKEFKDTGINRISLGLQTFNDDILKLINRGHNSTTGKISVDNIKNAGFENISIDLIYGLPNQTIEDFKNDLKQAVNVDVVHISTYGLKIDEGSYFYDNPPQNVPDDEIQAEMYLELCNFLFKYNHYEISNFAKMGYESRHNCAYWRNKEYYGFGENASGYEGNLRYKNISNFEEYIKNPLMREEEIYLTNKETCENEIFLALRLKQGININEINKKYNIEFMQKYGKIIQKYKEAKLLNYNDNYVSLTKQGILLSNEIMSEFIL